MYSYLLQENGDYLLQENGSFIIIGFICEIPEGLKSVGASMTNKVVGVTIVEKDSIVKMADKDIDTDMPLH